MCNNPQYVVRQIDENGNAPYLENENDNLNPILRKIFADGYTFYGIKEKNKKELLNINHYDDYLSLVK